MIFLENLHNSESIIRVLHGLISDKNASENPPEEFLSAIGFEELYNSLFEIRKAIADIGIGEFNCTVEGKGYLPGLIKNHFSSLKHLTWQTKAIASGDFSQNVDFLGEFSDSFNSMTKELNSTIKQLKKSEKQYRLLFENAAEAIIIIQDGAIKKYNTMAANLLGYSDLEITYQQFYEFIHDDDKEFVAESRKERIENQVDYWVYNFRLVCKDNKVRIVEMNSIVIEWEAEPATLNFLIDVTERKMMEDVLRQSEEKYRLLTEFASDVIWVLNLKTLKFVYISPAVYNLRGITADEAMMQSLEECMTPDSLEKVKKIIKDNLNEFLENSNSENYYTYEIQQPCKDGRVIWVEVSTKFRYNKEGSIEIVGVSRNIEKRKKIEKEITYLSLHDQLTGLYNRRFYEEEIERLDRTNDNLPISFIMADVNGLKLTNDAFGHLAGDELLKNVADIIKQECRKDDILARIGGDEFVILLPKTDSDGAKELVARIKQAIKSKRTNMILSVSFGYATKYKAEDDIYKMYKSAEDYMYKHKLTESTGMKRETIKLISQNLYKKSLMEQYHSERVGELSKIIGIAMGLSNDRVYDLGLAGLLHDIGKIGIDEKILNDGRKLNEEEWLMVKRHPEIGYQILKSANEFASIAEYVLAHHERIDGSGYPKGLKGEEIPLESKIISIADAFDAITHKHSYAEARTQAEAIAELKNNAGTQFDYTIAKVFVENVLKKKWD